MFPMEVIRERQGLVDLERRRRLVSQRAHQVHQYRREGDQTQAKIERIDAANPSLAQGDHGQTTTSWLMALFVLAAYGFDFALAGPVLHGITQIGILRTLLWI